MLVLAIFPGGLPEGSHLATQPASQPVLAKQCRWALKRDWGSPYFHLLGHQYRVYPLQRAIWIRRKSKKPYLRLGQIVEICRVSKTMLPSHVNPSTCS